MLLRHVASEKGVKRSVSHPFGRPKRWLIGSVLALAASALNASPASMAASTEAVLLNKSAQPWVAADIAGAGRVDCIVDIGANYSVLPRKLLAQGKYVKNLKVQTASGDIDMRIRQIDWVRVNSAGAFKVEFLEQDRSWFDPRDEMPCVLGTNFLRNFTVDFDGPSGTIRLFPKGTRIASIVGKARSTRFRVDATFGVGGLLTTNVHVQGQGAKADIDTGWGVATPNAALLHAIGMQRGDKRISTKQIDNPLTGNGRQFQVSQLRDFRIGGVLEDRVDIVLPEDRTREMDRGQHPHIQLGWDVLRLHRMVIDWTSRELVILP